MSEILDKRLSLRIAEKRFARLEEFGVGDLRGGLELLNDKANRKVLETVVLGEGIDPVNEQRPSVDHNHFVTQTAEKVLRVVSPELAQAFLGKFSLNEVLSVA